ncbi:MAG: hypothetical protein A2133_08075 [Actinobacteria bacterium RBG_16_64_13]|nr:MAG: hypothetical protein A2133_08075 [Actinobacteria bacterium RBG_16_64_13]
MKATLVIFIALALFLGLASAACAASWSDIETSTLDAYGISPDQIAQVSSGFPDGTWQPWRGITRAQFAKMAVTAFAVALANPASQSFSDVAPGHYYYPYIEGAHSAGLMKDVDEGLFDPAATMTREQAIAVVARKAAADGAFDLSSMKPEDIAAALADFDDAGSISASLRAELAFAASQGLTKGDSAGNLAPKAPVSRIAAAALLIRATEPKSLHLDAEDNGTTITVKVGDEIQVVLKGNSTTGFSWMATLSEEDAGILEQIGEPTYVPDSQLIGAGGTYTFTFKAVAAGDAALKLVYLRPWESVPPLETFEVRVLVGSLPLDDTAWRLEGWSVSSLDPRDFLMTAVFTDGHLSGKAAVNLYGGPYFATAGGDFSVGAIISTKIAGPEPAMRAERLYFELLQQVRHYQMSGDRLTLLDANNNELLIFAAVSLAADTGIEGEVWIGPISPVSKPGEPDSKPYSASIRIRSVAEDRIVAVVTSDENGRFRIALVPGRYVLEPEQGDPLPRASTQEVTVVAGQLTHVRIDYDSGIR